MFAFLIHYFVLQISSKLLAMLLELKEVGWAQIRIKVKIRTHSLRRNRSSSSNLTAEVVAEGAISTCLMSLQTIQLISQIIQ